MRQSYNFINKMGSLIAIIATAVTTPFLSFATDSNTTSLDKQRPKLVVEIVVGGMRYDQLYRMRSNFTQNGFKKLITDGATFTNARFSNMYTAPEPGSSIIATGTNPSGSGIIGSGWVNLTTNKIIDAFYNDNYQGVGCNEDEGQFSPERMTASTLADQIKAFDSASKVYSVALDKADAIIHGGYTPDGCYWYDVRYGKFATSSYYEPKLKSWVAEFNDSKLNEAYNSQLWSIEYAHDSYIHKNATTVLLDSNKKFSFDMLFKPKNHNYSKLTETPMGNTFVKDFALKIIQHDSLGVDNSTDLLVINMGSHRNISKIYGSESTETEDSYYKLDKDLALIIDELENTIGKDNFLLVVTSSHGVSPNVPNAASKGRGGKFNAMQFKAIISGFLNAQYGAENWVTDYNNRQIFLNRPLIYEKGISIEEIQKRIATIALQFDGIANAVTSTALETNYYGSGVLNKMQNSHFPRHGGDVMINLLPGWIEVDSEDDMGVVSNWGSPYEYDTHVPLFFYGKDIESQVIHDAVDMMDIAPTVSEISGITPPNASEGTVLNKIIGR